MKNIKLLLAVCVSVFCLLILFLFLEHAKKTVIDTIPDITTPTPVQVPFTPRTIPLQVTHVSPGNMASNVLALQPITITFNKNVSLSDISFFIFPEIDSTSSAQSSTITIIPTTPLSENIRYSYTITGTLTGNLLVTGSFATGDYKNAVIPLEASYPNLENTANKLQQQNYPDVFLSNYVPYATADFSVSAVFLTSPTGHYQFSVIQQTPFGKQRFLSWVKSLGLSDTEVAVLDIVYE